jgi:hypothetical protein
MANRAVALASSMRTLLTPERLRPYERVTSGDADRALDLYEWNTGLSAAVFEDLAYFEVFLRNACHNQLTRWCQRRGATYAWYLDPVLNLRSSQDVAEARLRTTRGNRAETAGRVVAELTFGFWRFLHVRRYEATLWTPCLRHVYPHQSPHRRNDVYIRLDHLNTLRNRVAHHEPIHSTNVGNTGLDIAALHHEMLELLGWIEPAIASWLQGRSRVPPQLAQRP